MDKQAQATPVNQTKANIDKFVNYEDHYQNQKDKDAFISTLNQTLLSPVSTPRQNLAKKDLGDTHSPKDTAKEV